MFFVYSLFNDELTGLKKESRAEIVSSKKNLLSFKCLLWLTNLFCFFSVLMLSSCSLDVAGLSRNDLYNKIDRNTDLSEKQKLFAKRYYLQYRSMVQDIWIMAEDQEHWDLVVSKKSNWHLDYGDSLTFEEKVYISSIHKMANLWKTYDRIDVDNLSKQERKFLNDVEVEYGEKVDRCEILKKADGRLTKKEKEILDTVFCFTNNDTLDDRGLVMLFRLEWSSIIPLSDVKQTKLSPLKFRKIIDFKHHYKDGLVLYTLEYDAFSHPEWRSYFYNRVILDEEGYVKKIERIRPWTAGLEQRKITEIRNEDDRDIFFWSTSNKQDLVSHLFNSDCWINDRLYMGLKKGKKIDSKLLISTKKTKKRIRDWWVIDSGDRKLLFVLVCEFRFPDNIKRKIYHFDSNSYLYHYLQCYRFEDNKIEFRNEVAIDNKYNMVKDLEIGIDRNEFYLWLVDKPRGMSTRNRLRMCKWNDGVLSDWRNCYRESSISNLNINHDSASGARVCARKLQSQGRPAEMFFVVRGDKILHKVLSPEGSYLQGSAYINELDMWAVFSKERNPKGYFINFLDTNLNSEAKVFLSKKNKTGYIYTSRLLYTDGKLYLVTLTGENDNKVFIKNIPLPMRSSSAVGG